METITITIDGEQIRTQQGKTVLEAALDAGIYIPNLCYHPNLSPWGACRLCVVQVEGVRGIPTACTLKAENGMVVKTTSPEIDDIRRMSLELMLATHPQDCLVCKQNLNCELQAVAQYIGITKQRLRVRPRAIPPDTSNPLFVHDFSKCILCGRCVRACYELRGVGVLSFMKRGKETYIGTAFGRSLIDANCRFCGACVEVCPTGALRDKEEMLEVGKKREPASAGTDIPRYIRFIAEKKYSEAAAVLREKSPVSNMLARVWREAVLVPCKHTCPAGIDIPRYIRFIAEKKYSEAAAVVREKAPLPNVLAHVCNHPCESVCRRGKLNDAVSIRGLKRAATQREIKSHVQPPRRAPSTGKKIAVVGSGPAGLTAAYYLAKLGHAVTIFEALPVMGGMLRVGIPEYRLPTEVLDAEIQEIVQVGLDIRTNTRVESLDDLFAQGYHAIFIAIGAHQGQKLGVEGDECPGVIDAITFLRQVRLGQAPRLGRRVAVIGGGNVAIDAARTALRVGSTDVTILYRRTRAEMPASSEEIEGAIEEGVKIVYLTAPSKVWRQNSALKLECIRMELGEPDASGRRRPVPIKGSEFTEEYDNIVVAIGQALRVPAAFKVTTEKGGTIRTWDECATSREGVFAGGDVVTGPASVIEAIASGRKAAMAIDKYLGGKGVIDEVLAPSDNAKAWLGCEEGFGLLKRNAIPCIPVEQRLDGFREVEVGYDEETAGKEALRCLQCDLRLQISPVKLPPKRYSTKGG